MVAKVAEASGQQISFHSCNLKSPFDSPDNEALRRLTAPALPIHPPKPASPEVPAHSPPRSPPCSPPQLLLGPGSSASKGNSNQPPIVFLFCYVLNEVFGKSKDPSGFDLVAKLMQYAAETRRAHLFLFREPNEWAQLILLQRNPSWVEGVDYWRLDSPGLVPGSGGLMVHCKGL